MSQAQNVLQQAMNFGIIPVIEIERLEDAVPLAEALLEGGLGVVEITFRTQAAADVIARISERYKEMLVGAGTVVTSDDLGRAYKAGARFALAPGLSRHMLKAAAKLGLPYAPGAMSPSDIQAGIENNIKIFKFFPAVPAGGIPFLRSISAPFTLNKLRFIPTGGVSQANLQEWLREDAVGAVGGTWIATKSLIDNRSWQTVSHNAREAVAVSRSSREDV